MDDDESERRPLFRDPAGSAVNAIAVVAAAVIGALLASGATYVATGGAPVTSTVTDTVTEPATVNPGHVGLERSTTADTPSLSIATGAPPRMSSPRRPT